MSRTRRASWAFATNVMFTVVTLVTGMVATPLIVGWLGAGRFGAYQWITGIAGYIALLELGLGGGILAMLSQALGRRDESAVRMTMVAGFRAAAVVSALMLLAGAVIVPTIPRLIPVAPGDVSDLQLGFGISMLAALTFPLQPFRSLLEASQRSYLVNAMIIVQCLVITGLTLAFARSGGGIAGQAAGVTIGVLGMSLVMARVGLSRYPGLLGQIWEGRSPAELRRSLWQQNRASMTFSVCSRIALLSDNLIVGYFLGVEAVAMFVLTRRLAEMAQIQLMAVGNSTWAGLSEIYLSGTRAVFDRTLTEVSRLLTIFGMTVLIPVAAYNRAFIGLWMRPLDLYAGDAVTIAIAINAFLLPFIALLSWMFTGLGRLPRLVPTVVLGTVINLAISVAATRAFGMVGPLLGTLVVYLGYFSWKVPLLLKEEFAIAPGLLARSILPPVALGVPCAPVVWWFARAYPPQGWPGLALAMAATATLYPVLAWWLVVTRDERTVWLGRIRSLLGRVVARRPARSSGHEPARPEPVDESLHVGS